jgi:hypothetical protein
MNDYKLSFHKADRDYCVRYSVWSGETCILMALSWEYQKMWTLSDLYTPHVAFGKTRQDVCIALEKEYRPCPSCDVIGGIELFWNKVIKHERAK